MQAPDFWFRSGWSWQRLALLPLTVLYALAQKLDWHLKAMRQQQAALPVICIGNLTVGGTGKTPVTLWLGNELVNRDHNPVVISRGYGGNETGPVRVDPSQHSAHDIGDEPLMMARYLPVIVARDRVAGAALAHRLGYDCILLDDGLQNPGLAKDYSLVVADATTGFGNRSLLPGGPLREALQAGLNRSDALIMVGDGPVPVGLTLPRHISMALAPMFDGLDKGADWLAFCGIGRPAKFFDTLRQAGFKLAEIKSFPDHYDYHPDDLAGLLSTARTRGLSLITTEKDAVKIPPSLKRDIAVLPLTLNPTDLATSQAVVQDICAIITRINKDHAS